MNIGIDCSNSIKKARLHRVLSRGLKGAMPLPGDTLAQAASMQLVEVMCRLTATILACLVMLRCRRDIR